MDLTYAQLGLCVGATAVALSAGVGAFRHHRTARAGVPLAVILFSLATWSALLLAQSTLPSAPWRTAAVAARLLAGSAIVAAFFCETRALSDVAWRLRGRTAALLAVHPVLLLTAVVTNPWHHLFATTRPAGTGESLPWGTWQPGPFLWAHVIYSYLLLLGCCLTLTAHLLQASTDLQVRQLASVVVTAMLPVTGTVVTLVRPDSPVTRTVTPLLIVVACLVHYYAVLRLGRLRLLPVARGLVLEHVGDAIFVLDRNDQVVDVNPAGRALARRLQPALPHDLIGVPARLLLPHRRNAASLEDSELHLDRPGGALHLDLRLSDLADGNGRTLGRAVVVRDISELHEQRQRLAEVNQRLMDQLQVIDALRHDLAELAVRDDLTGLHNRRYLLGELETLLDAARSGARPLSVMLLDIDHFKNVNDRHGHAVGDALLVATARALTDCVRVGDTVARYGGEEFVVLLPGTSRDEAHHLAEVLRLRCGTVRVDTLPDAARDGRSSGWVATTMSAGVATFPVCGWTPAELLQSADEALDAAKRAGRDRVVCAPLT